MQVCPKYVTLSLWIAWDYWAIVCYLGKRKQGRESEPAMDKLLWSDKYKYMRINHILWLSYPCLHRFSVLSTIIFMQNIMLCSHRCGFPDLTGGTYLDSILFSRNYSETVTLNEYSKLEFFTSVSGTELLDYFVLRQNVGLILLTLRCIHSSQIGTNISQYS